MTFSIIILNGEFEHTGRYLFTFSGYSHCTLPGSMSQAICTASLRSGPDRDEECRCRARVELDLGAGPVTPGRFFRCVRPRPLSGTVRGRPPPGWPLRPLARRGRASWGAAEASPAGPAPRFTNTCVPFERKFGCFSKTSCVCCKHSFNRSG